jgi:hypothetical protein
VRVNLFAGSPLVVLFRMSPKSRKDKKRSREEENVSATALDSTPQPKRDEEDKLQAEGEKLSGAALREFLKKNFLDFAADECAKIFDVADACDAHL